VNAEPTEQAAASPNADPNSDSSAAEVHRAVPAGAAEPGSSPHDVGAEAEAAARSRLRRELGTTVLIALLGGVIAWVAAGRVWATGTAGEVPSTLQVSATGNDLSAAVTALALTALAGALALPATQRLARRLVGVLLVAVGIGAAVNAFSARGAGHAAHILGEKAAAKGFASGSVPAHTASWWLLAVVGGVLIVVAGAVAIVRGAAWPGMSSRYENAAPKPASVVPETAKDIWDALDRGEDPTEPARPPAPTITPNR